MKRTFILLVVLLGLALVACNREAGLGAGGGQSLREGATSPYHSDIAQDETYQTLLGLNMLLFPAPVDDPKFEPYGEAHWELDATNFTELMVEQFDGEMGDETVYEPVVEGLQDHPLVLDIRDLIYDGEPVQVGWAYGKNESLDFLEYNGAPATLVTVYPAIVFVAGRDDFNEEDGAFSTSDALATYIPENTVVELYEETLRSLPVPAVRTLGQLTAIIVPEGTGTEPAAPGSGFDQALVANNRWVFATADAEGDFYEGLSGRSVSIEPADSSPRFSD